MATLVFAAAGAAIGKATLGAGLLGISGGQIGWFAGSMIGSALFGQGGQNIKQEGARLSDLKVQVASYGAPIPIYFGTERGTGNVIWSTDLKETKHTSRSRSGGKGGGGGGSVTTTWYTYSVSFAVSVCDTYGRKPKGIQRVWANNKLILDFRSEAVKSKDFRGDFRIYLGKEDQLASSLQEAHLGVGNVPAYRGQMTVEFENMELEEFGNTIPNLSFEVVMESDNPIASPTVYDTTDDTGFYIHIFASDEPIPQRFALRSNGTTTVAGLWNLETNTFTPKGAEIPIAFIGNMSAGVQAHRVFYYSPITQKVEQAPAPYAFILEFPGKVYIFNTNSYALINTIDFVQLQNDDEIDFDNSAQLLGTLHYDEKQGIVYVFKAHPFANAYFAAICVNLVTFNPLTGKLKFNGPEVLTSSTVFGDNQSLTAYLKQDMVVGFTGQGVGSGAITVERFTQKSLWSVPALGNTLFTSTIPKVFGTGVAAFYDDSRNRLIFIHQGTGSKLQVSYYSVSRTEVQLTGIAILTNPLNIQNVYYENNYTISSTVTTVDVLDESGNLVTGTSPLTAMGGMTRDQFAYWYVDADAKTYNIDADTFRLIENNTGNPSHTIYRAGLFAPNYVEKYGTYGNTVYTSNANGINRFTISPPMVGQVSLSSVVEKISSKVGLADKVDVSALAQDTVYGYKIAQAMPAREAIETLQRAYSFDSVETS